MRGITRTVWLLSLVSLFTDFASEMLYPIMPVYLDSIGFSAVFIGLLEGVAEAIAGLSKGIFGSISDRLSARLPFVRLGYFLSAISKPMIVLFQNPLWVFGTRTGDRLGKGIRTAARDSMLNEESASENKGTVFGFHRAMDTTGAIIGPLFAMVFLFWNPTHYHNLFYIAAIPGIIAIALTFTIKEKSHKRSPSTSATSFRHFFKIPDKSSGEYKILITGLLLFAVFNSSDFFLLMRVKEMGFSDTQMLLMYIFYNAVYAVFSIPAGRMSDKLGMKPVFLTGLIFFIASYSGLALFHDLSIVWICFTVYGFFSACTDGVSKAWIGLNCRKEDSGKAYGFFLSFQSLAIMISSFATGWIWSMSGSMYALLFCSAGALISVIFLWFTAPGKQKPNFAL